ncbi:MAG TPA: DUF1697 domain-containing protein [Verrucomicrobiae bacterium]|jgi:uncharacterized protein (DUF1697 family)|nr:DUF1697 domain-containing protein [Verrucomicrobiae bacterium]
MTTCVAILRGINVSGHKIIKMERLRAAFEDLGFAHVKTYVQSGNVVFETAESPASLAGRIETKILDEFGFEVPVLTKSSKELKDIVKRNPFVKDPAIDQTKLHVTFLSGDPPRNALDALEPLAAGGERVALAGRAVYLYCPNGYGNTKLTNTTIEKKLSCRATTRNWATTNKLLEMAGQNR